MPLEQIQKGMVFFMNNNMNMAELMSMLAKMDKKDLEQGLNKVSQMLKTKDANSIIDEFKKNT